MIRTAQQILADIRAQGGEEDLADAQVLLAQPQPEPEGRVIPAVDRSRRLPGVVDIDAGVGRLLVGYDRGDRYATVWIGEAPPDAGRRRGCPSDSQYRRHLAAGERCPECREHVRQLERQRRARARARTGGVR